MEKRFGEFDGEKRKHSKGNVVKTYSNPSFLFISSS